MFPSLERGLKGRRVGRKIVIALILVCGLLGDATAADWVLLNSNNGVNFYYDKGSIKHRAGGVIDLLTRVVFENSQIRSDIISDIIKERRSKGLSVEGWDKLHEIVNLVEIDCRSMKYSFVSGDHYDERGNLLDTSKPEAEQWIPILVNSPMMGTYNAVCK